MSQPAPALGDVLDFMRLLWAVDHALHRASKRMAAHRGVTGPQRLVVRIVGKFPGIAAGRLAALLHVHPSTLSGVLARLEKQRLLRRRVDPADARRSLLDLTAKGKRLDSDRDGTVEAIVETLLRATPRSRVRAARQLLAAMAVALEGEEGDAR